MKERNKVGKILFTVLASFIVIISACGSDNLNKIGRKTKFLDKETALHLYNQKKLLQCYNPNNYNKKPILVTDSFEALRIGNIVFFQRTNYSTYEVLTANASYCLRSDK